MLKKNEIWVGLILGLLLPIIGFGILYGIFAYLDRADAVSNIGLGEDFRLRTIGIVSIGLNAILLNKKNKKRATRSMRGIVLATFIYIIVWLIYFGDTVLNAAQR